MQARFDAAGVAVVVRDDGIVEFDYGEMVMVDEDQADATLRSALDQVQALGIALPRPTLVGMGRVSKVTRGARQAFAVGEVNGQLTNRVALITSSPTSRIIGNFFLGWNRGHKPTRLFEDEAAAVAWVLQG